MRNIEFIFKVFIGSILATTKGGDTAIVGFHWPFQKPDCSKRCLKN